MNFSQIKKWAFLESHKIRALGLAKYYAFDLNVNYCRGDFEEYIERLRVSEFTAKHLERFIEIAKSHGATSLFITLIPEIRNSFSEDWDSSDLDGAAIEIKLEAV